MLSTPQELAKREARTKKFSTETQTKSKATPWENVVLRSRYHDVPSEKKSTGKVFIFLRTREEQKKYHLHIKSLKKDSINTKLPNKLNRWPEIIQSYRKLREAIVGENTKIDKFTISVYQDSVEACLKAKEFSDEKLIDDELAKSLLTLVNTLYPAYMASPDKLTNKRKKKIGLFYSYYLFYLLGSDSARLGQVLAACKQAPSGFVAESADVQLATEMCLSAIHLRYTSFFPSLKLCKPSQRLLLKVESA